MKVDHLAESNVAQLIRGVIHGNLPGKANSRKIVKFGGILRVIKSDEARDWEERFQAAVAFSARNLHTIPWKKGIPLQLTAEVYYDSMRQDLEVELLKDALQRAGVIENDRYIFKVMATRRVDKNNPRVEFALTKFKDRV